MASKRAGGDELSFDMIFKALHLEGRLDAARDAYRRLLDREPDHVGALANLGQILRRQGKKEEALALYRRAAALPGAPPELLFNLANAEDDAGNPDDALAALAQALETKPDMVQALHKRGLILSRQELWGEAVTALRAAARAAPTDPVVRCDLGVALTHDGAPELGEAMYRWSIADQPGVARPRRLLADLLARSRRTAEAETIYRGLLDSPEQDKAVTALADLLLRRNEPGEAIDLLRRRHQAAPASTGVAVTLAGILLQMHLIQEAVDICRRLLADNPREMTAQIILASALSKLHRNAESIELSRQVIESNKNAYMVISNQLFTSLYSDDMSAEALAGLHREMAEHFPPPADDAPRRRRASGGTAPVRIGFYTPDLQSNHPVSQFFEPVLANLDTDRFHTTIYARVNDPDATTARFQRLPSTWRDLANRTAEQVRATLLDDKLDILIDLAGHTADNGLRFFSQRVAPVQATYIGYPHSTGLREMDYLIGDAIACPPELAHLYSETVIRPNPCLWVFQPPQQIVRRQATRRPGAITFGSLNSSAKLSDRCLALWARILQRCPDATLLLKAGAFADPASTESFRQRLADHGADPARIQFEPPEPFQLALGAYDAIDIMLDSVPFNGGTTSCQSLWMGVPVLTRQGRAMCQRLSSSFLTAVGLEELITDSDDAYVELACALAADPARVARLRHGLHQRVLTSLCDGPTYTRNLERGLLSILEEAGS